MGIKKSSKNKIARQLTYKTVTGILPVLHRFAATLGINDIDELSTIICNMSVDEFCDFKFNDISDVEDVDS